MKLLSSILFASDFLPASEKSAGVVARLARQFDSRVTLLHVIESAPHWMVGFPFAVERAMRELQRCAARFGSEGVTVADSVVKVGPVPDTILRQAHVLGADLIVLGAGETTTGRFVLDPVAQEVMERAEPPVLAIHPETAEKFDSILCPVDHSEVSRRALKNAIWLARAFGANLQVLSVVPAVSWLTAAAECGSLSDAQLAHANRWEAELNAFLGPIDFEGVRWSREMPEGVPAREIVSAARRHRSDLVVMGSTGRTGLVRMLMGSVTRRVLRDLPCSLLTVKEEGIASEMWKDLHMAEALVEQGRGLLHARSYSAAADKFRLALKHDPALVPALHGLSESLDHLGQKDEASSYRERLEAVSGRPG